MTIETKLKIDSFQKIAPLGSGASGDVWHVTDGIKEYALKLYKSSYGQESDQEIEHLQKLNHPNIVKGIKIGRWEGAKYLLMEYVPGTPLFDITSSQLSPLQIENVIFQLADAMNYAHHQGIIHRDLKPQNIILTKDFQVKVLDFGVAATIAYNPNVRIVEGTYNYMSPEQLAGRINYQNDIWAFGVTCFQWLTGQHPYPSKNIEEFCQNILLINADFTHQLNPNVPHKISFIIDKCLQKDLKKRYHSFVEIVNDLETDPTISLTAQIKPNETQAFIDSFNAQVNKINLVTVSVLVALLAIIVYTYLQSPYNFIDIVTKLTKSEGFYHFTISGWSLIGTVVLYVKLSKKLHDNFEFENPSKRQALAFYSDRDKFAKFLKKAKNFYDIREWEGKLLNQMSKEGQIRSAREMSKGLLFKDGNNLEALSYLAVDNFKKGNLQKSQEMCAKILAINPDDAAVMFLEKILSKGSQTVNTTIQNNVTQTLNRDTVTQTQVVSTIGNLSKTIAEQGSANLPVEILMENFVGFPRQGSLILFNDYLNITTKSIDFTQKSWESWEKLTQLRNPFAKGFQIMEGKLKYYRHRINNFDSDVFKNGPPVATGLPLLLNSLKNQGIKGIETVQKQKMEAAMNHIDNIPYSDINRIALYGKLWEVEGMGLLALNCTNITFYQEFIDILSKWNLNNQTGDKKRNTTEPNKNSRFNQLNFQKFMGTVAAFLCVGLILYVKGVFSINYKEMFNEPFFYIGFPIILSIVFYFYRNWLKALWKKGREENYWYMKQLKHFFSPRKNADWIHERERDSYLECVRIVFNKTLIFSEGKKLDTLKTDYQTQQIINTSPFKIDFLNQQISPNTAPNKVISFLEINKVAITSNGLIFKTLNGEAWHNEPLDSKQFQEYVPYLLEAFKTKIQVGE